MQTSITAAFLRRLVFGCGPIAALLLGDLAACQRSDADVAPAQLERAEVDPEGGRRLYVRGSGFLPGQACKLSLRGTQYAPGETGRSIAQTVPCRALSDVHVVASLDAFQRDPKVPALFEGRLELQFARAAQGMPRTHVLEAARLRLVDPGRLAPAEQLAWTRRAHAAQLALGILDVEPTPRGLKLNRLAPEGAAVRAGCLPSDVLTRLNGAPVERPLDLIGAERDDARRAELLRSGRAEPISVQLDTRRAPTAAELLAPFWVVLAAVLAFLLPGPKLPRATGRARSVRTCLAFGSGLLALNAAFGSRVDARVLWLAPVSLRALWLVQAHAQRKLSLSELLSAFADLGIASLGVATLGIVHGSLLAPLGGPESAWPWQWPLWSTPVTFLALLALTGSTDTAPITRMDHHTRDLLLAGKACTVAGFAIGAGSLPFADASFGAPGFAWVLLGLKLPLAWSLLSWIRWPLSSLHRGLLALLAPALAVLLGPLLPPQAMLVQVLGATLFGLTLGFVARALWRATRTRSEPRDPALMPFL